MAGFGYGLPPPVAYEYDAPVFAAPPAIYSPMALAAPVPFAAPPPVFSAPAVGLPPQLPDPAFNALVDEGVEYDEEYWKYSRFALPWLVFCLALLVTVFCLTFWQQAGDIKRWFDGVPRVLIRRSVAGTNYEAGIPKNVRNLRIAAFVCIIVGVVIAVITYFLRPKPGIRIALCAVASLLLFAGAVIAWVAFGIALDHQNNAVQCHENYLYTHAHCIRRTAYEIVDIALDAGMGTFGIIAAVLLILNARYHWRLAPRTIEEEEIDRIREPVKERIPGYMVHKNVSFVRKWLVSLALLMAFISAVGSIVFTIILSEDQNTELLRGPRGRGDRSLSEHSIFPFEHSGWPRINTAIRYAGTAVGILAVFFNFMPFRSKTIAIIFGFLYFVSASLLLICFGFDVHEIRRAKRFGCPRQFDGAALQCFTNPFTTTCVIEFIAVVALLLYIIVEYFINGCRFNS